MAALAVMTAGPAWADPPATVRSPSPPPVASDLRLSVLPDRKDPTLRIDDPRSRLRSGYGGSMVDLFPLAGGNLHLSGGPRLFGRAGRRRPTEPENLALLPAFRAGPKLSRRFSPALLVGYGRPVDRGLSLGVDAGLVMGRIHQGPDRLGRLDRQRLEGAGGRSARDQANPLARMTALYRF